MPETNLRSALTIDLSGHLQTAFEGALRRLGFATIDTASGWQEGRALVAARKPDLLIAYVRMDGEQSGSVEELAAARALNPTMKVVATSEDANIDEIRRALASGADAFVRADTHPDDLATAVRQLFTRMIYFADRVAGERRQPYPDARVFRLTPRERELVALMAAGLSNAQIARQLWVSEQTVKWHLTNAYRKLGVRNRTQASAVLHGTAGRSAPRLDGVTAPR